MTEWIIGRTHWGEADIYYLCSEQEWDGDLRVNGHPAIRVAPCMSPEVAERIVEIHNNSYRNIKQ